jgi:hypothetical protein
LSKWLVEELWTKYQVPRKIGQIWIDADQVLPLLDGLDEVAKEARSACTQQINDYYQSRLEHGSSPLVVCCRSEEYAALSTRVILQHAVSILPLTDEQISAYLEQAEEQIQGLRQALNEDAELHSLARQPLMLTIFTFAYRGVSVAEIPTGETGKEMQHAIFARYVEHMLKRRGQSKRWQPEQVMKWLTFLAKEMQRHDQTVFFVENLQPNWLSRRWRILYQWCVGLVIGLGIVLYGELIWIIVYSFFPWSFSIKTGNIIEGLLGPLPLELLEGLFCGLFFCLRPIRPFENLIWSWSDILSKIFVGLSLGVSGGAMFFFSKKLRMKIAGRQLTERLHLAPNEGIQRSAKNGIQAWLLLIPFLGTFTGLLATLSGVAHFGLGMGLFLGLLQVMFSGLFYGFLLGLFFGLGAFTQHFILRFFLSQRGNLPWNLVPFLDEAAERLLLRKVGGSYIFVHRLLLDYFAGLGEKDKV